MLTSLCVSGPAICPFPSVLLLSLVCFFCSVIVESFSWSVGQLQPRHPGQCDSRQRPRAVGRKFAAPEAEPNLPLASNQPVHNTLQYAARVKGIFTRVKSEKPLLAFVCMEFCLACYLTIIWCDMHATALVLVSFLLC